MLSTLNKDVIIIIIIIISLLMGQNYVERYD